MNYLSSHFSANLVKLLQLLFVDKRESEDVSVLAHTHQELAVETKGNVLNRPRVVIMRVNPPIGIELFQRAPLHVLHAHRSVLQTKRHEIVVFAVKRKRKKNNYMNLKVTILIGISQNPI